MYCGNVTELLGSGIEGQFQWSVHGEVMLRLGGAVIVEVAAALAVEDREDVIDMGLVEVIEAATAGNQQRQARFWFSTWPRWHRSEGHKTIRRCRRSLRWFPTRPTPSLGQR